MLGEVFLIIVLLIGKIFLIIVGLLAERWVFFLIIDRLFIVVFLFEELLVICFVLLIIGIGMKLIRICVTFIFVELLLLALIE